VNVLLCSYSVLGPYTLSLGNGLARRGHSVHLYMTRGLAEAQFTSRFRDLFEPGLVWHDGPRQKLRYPTYWRRTVDILRGLRKARAQIFHYQEASDPALAIATLLVKRPPRVCVTHDVEWHPGDVTRLPPLTEFSRRTLRRRANRFVVHGERLKEQLVATGIPREQVCAMPHGALCLYRRWHEPGEPGREGPIVFFGRLSRYKGIGSFIEVAKTVLRTRPDARFEVAGLGLDIKDYREWLQRTPEVTFSEGFMPPPEVARMFASASMAVLPYVEASQSGVASIAMAFGVPAVVTDVGSLSEMVLDGVSGLVVPPGDTEAVADAVLRLLGDARLRRRLAEGALARAEAEYGWDTVAERTVHEVYEPLLS
jgi:glycosyltransferase involved in cell wall biosynthesis